jgi:hypothetical protein
MKKKAALRQKYNKSIHVTDWQKKNHILKEIPLISATFDTDCGPRGPALGTRSYCGAPSITRRSGCLEESALQSRTRFHP